MSTENVGQKNLLKPAIAPQALFVFIAYRVLLSFGLLLYFLMNFQWQDVGNDFIYLMLISGYFILSCIFIGLYYFQKASLQTQLIVQVFFDIFFLSGLLIFSHDMFKQFILLMNISIAAGSILVPGRVSFLFSAVATFSIFIVHFLLESFSPINFLSYAEISFWGATFFATAVVSYALSRRIRASEALAQQRGVDLEKFEALTADIISRLPQGIIVLDRDNNIRLSNIAARENLMLETEYSKKYSLLPTLENILTQWRARVFITEELPSVITTEGLALHTQITQLDDQGTLFILSDDPSRIAEQAQANKLLSLGRLSASIAHEIRNPLSAMLHAVQLLQENENIPASDGRLVDIIQQEGSRINNIVENILQISRRQVARRTIFLLKPWILEVFSQFQSAIKKGDRLSCEIVEDALSVCCDPSQLHQVLYNIIENGLRHSRTESRHGAVHVKAYYETDSQQIIIDVLDEGPGIAPENMRDVFEPFFTTNRQGSGLGLYIAKELCEANQIRLQFFNCAEGGCCFRLKFHERMRY